MKGDDGGLRAHVIWSAADHFTFSQPDATIGNRMKEDIVMFLERAMVKDGITLDTFSSSVSLHNEQTEHFDGQICFLKIL